MIFKNNTYDFLKWTTLIGIPAAAALYSGFAQLFAWPYAAEVTQAAALICAFLGTVLGISNYQYNKRVPQTPESVYDLDDLEPLQLDDDETEIEEHEDGGVM